MSISIYESGPSSSTYDILIIRVEVLERFDSRSSRVMLNLRKLPMTVFCSSIFVCLLLCLMFTPTNANVPVSVAAAREEMMKSVAETETGSGYGASKRISSEDECSLWMAPSNAGTSKHPKYGLFAGRSYKLNETLPHSELVFPLIDFVQSWNRDTPTNDAIIEFVESHLWTSQYAGSQWEGNHSAPVAIPGIGTLAQYHSGIENVDFIQASVLLRDRPRIWPSGQAHLARGAVTPYYNATLRATREIPAGMELFANFGDVWDGNHTDDFYQDKLTRFDYEEADKIIDHLIQFYDEYADELTFELQDDILDFVLGRVLDTASGKHAKVIRSLIPAHPKKLYRVREAGGSFMYRYNDMIKSTEWLKENGFCLDSIREGPSTIPDAGRGAFANRFIPSGSVIVPSPMLHIANENLLNMYQIQTVMDRTSGALLQEYDRTKPVGKQMLLNYCFGHAESSLLLFPLGSHVSLINHKPEGQAANAYITWSRDAGLPNQHQYHDRSVKDLAATDRVVLVMKVVALRDIQPGEEIFLDYGTEWEQAWRDYRFNYELKLQQKGREYPLKAEDMREKYRSRPFETTATIRENPYPRNVGTACFLRSADIPDGQPMFDEVENLNISQWIKPVSFGDYHGDQLFIVDILDRKEAPGHFFNYTLKARVFSDRIEKVVGVPHAACTFVDRPYTSDLSLPNSFRHPIGILDGHFPPAWRDLKTR